MIESSGRSLYSFTLGKQANFEPDTTLVETKILNSTPGIITKYALSDEQALLAILRYNRLIDIFTGVACYSLQNHLRTFVKEIGQVETDEVYVGVDKKGIHYIFPVQAKGGNDRLGIIQIKQDFALCQAKFSNLVCRPIAAQFMRDNVIALFEFELTEDGIRKSQEKHYKLVPNDELTEEDLDNYKKRTG